MKLFKTSTWFSEESLLSGAVVDVLAAQTCPV